MSSERNEIRYVGERALVGIALAVAAGVAAGTAAARSLPAVMALLALFVGVVLGQRRARVREMVAEELSPTVRACPECQEEMPLRARRCPHCASRVDLPVALIRSER